MYKELARIIKRASLSAPVEPPVENPRASFSYGTFKVSCLNSRTALEALAARFEKGPTRCTTPPLPKKESVARPGKGGQSRALLKRYADDPELMAELASLLHPEHFGEW